MTNKKKIAFSGAQPTGVIHLGNYFGAMKNWLTLQKAYQSYFSVVDLHALTTVKSASTLAENIFGLSKLFLAIGLDPTKAIIFRQSAVKEHTELAWILNCLTPIAELERMTQFKDKAARHAKDINAGLLNYPVLMAADILLYDTEIVPVGEDQVQHVELARIIARKFNKLYGETFTEPAALLHENTAAARLKGLDDPTKKMSKSATSVYNYISLLDKPEVIKQKIKKAVTDSGSTIEYTTTRPALANLIDLYSLVTDLRPADITANFSGLGYGAFKADLTDKIIAFLTPIQERFAAIETDELNEVYATGAALAGKQAARKMAEIKAKIGF